MNYAKKDEDADTALMKVDRTSVFQEGWWLLPSILYEPSRTHFHQLDSSTHRPSSRDDAGFS